MKRCLIVALLFLFSVLGAAASSSGSIRGVVIDQAGNPVSLASVLTRDAEPSTTGAVEVQTGAVPWIETDNEGKFVIRGLTPGHHYKVYAKKEEDGYADPTIPTYNPTDEAPVVVASDAPRSSPDVRLQLGPKAVLFAYDLKDAVTGKRLKNYTITVTRTDTDYTFSGMEADNKVLLPADVDMRIKFDVPGYQSWFYPSGGNTKEAAAPVRGARGEEKHVEVFLTPEAKPPANN